MLLLDDLKVFFFIAIFEVGIPLHFLRCINPQLWAWLLVFFSDDKLQSDLRNSCVL